MNKSGSVLSLNYQNMFACVQVVTTAAKLDRAVIAHLFSSQSNCNRYLKKPRNTTLTYKQHP